MTDLVIRIPTANLAAAFTLLKGTAIGRRLLNRARDQFGNETGAELNEFRTAGKGWCLTTRYRPVITPPTVDDALWIYLRSFGNDRAEDIIEHIRTSFPARVMTRNVTVDGVTRAVPDDRAIRYL